MSPPSLPRPLRLAARALVAIALLVGGLAAWDRLREPAYVAAWLGLAAPPASLRVVACEDWSFTDELARCSLEIEPRELPALLSGQAWTREPATGTSHSVLGEPRVGPAFPVARRYHARPAAFTHGGLLTLCTDAAGQRVLLDVYRE